MRCSFVPHPFVFALALLTCAVSVPFAMAATDWSNPAKDAPAAPAASGKQDAVNAQTVIVPSGAPAQLTLPDGSPATPENLPTGYACQDDGGIETPQGVIILPEGVILDKEGRELPPDTHLPPGFRREGERLVTPEGLVFVLPPPGTAPWREEEESAKPEAPQDEPEAKKVSLSSLLPLTNMDGSESPASPKPEDKQTAEQSSQPKSGDPFRIPEDAVATNDLSFLEGCWVSDDLRSYTGVWNNPKAKGERHRAKLCFKKNGSGTFTASKKGERCSGPAKARFSGATLSVQTQKAPCRGSAFYFVPRTFECRGASGNTECFIVANNKWEGRKRQGRANFRRE